jgi:hypothetical protein
MGISGKHVVKTFGPIKDIKVRYVAHFFYLEYMLSAIPYTDLPALFILTKHWSPECGRKGTKLFSVSLRE